MTFNGQFCTLTTKSGIKTININAIAVIEDINPNAKITMMATKENNESISFITDLPYSYVVTEINKSETNLRDKK